MSAAAIATVAVAASPEGGPSPRTEEVPADLSVPTGHAVAFTLAAEGVQIYACAQGPATPGWTLRAPEARLYEESGRAAGTHYAGPTWESSDGSKVVGAKVSGATVDADAIPWLLLRAESHAGSGRMGGVTFVQRIRTSGGVAPAGGCDSAHTGAVARVPYRAVYRFFRAAAAPG
jgi:hypothetical protein